MKTYEVEGTLVTIVNANDGAEAIRKVEEEHGGILNASAIEVEPTKDDFFSEISEFVSEFKRLEDKYGLTGLGVSYIPETLKQIPSVRLDTETFIDVFDEIEDSRINKSEIGGTECEYWSIIFDGVEYHTIFLRK